MMTSVIPSLNLPVSLPLSSLSLSSSFSLVKLNHVSLYKRIVRFSSKSKTRLNPSPNPCRRHFAPLAINIPAENSEEQSKKREIDGVVDRARQLFDNLPQPVKKFPWAQTVENFFGIILDLALAVVKYLLIPILALTHLSEMSYCAHERKMALIPIPFLVGVAVAEVMKDTSVELDSDIKEGVFPSHLLVIAIFFALLKLPGPNYPYWGRLLIPHFANGGLWRSVWLTFMWYRESQRSAIGDNN